MSGYTDAHGNLKPEYADPTPLTKGEFEQFKKDQGERVDRFTKRSIIALLCIFVALLGSGVVNAKLLHENTLRANETAQIAKENQHFSVELSDALIEACEDNGNPVREAVHQFGEVLINQQTTEQARSEALAKAGLFDAAFGGHAKVLELVQEGHERSEKAVSGLQNATEAVGRVNCKTTYPSR